MIDVLKLPPHLVSIVRMRRQDAAHPWSVEAYSDEFTRTAAEICRVLDAHAGDVDDIREVLAAYLAIERDQGARAASSVAKEKIDAQLEHALAVGASAARATLDE